MQRRFVRLTSLLLVFLTLFMLCSFGVSAAEPIDKATEGRAAKIHLSVSGIGNKSFSYYRKADVYINGRAASFGAKIINGVAYLPTEEFIESVSDAEAVYDSGAKVLTATGHGYDISVSDGAYVLYSSQRPMFALTPSVVLSDGNMYSPISVLSKAMGLSISYSDSVSVSGRSSPITRADKFYREDAVYWLSRIINAESRGEPLLGQIAVGGVVLNRVDSSLYPNTIWGVIFDKKYGVQFSPILDGSIYGEPTYTSILAAKICLEGFSLSDDTLFFLYPGASTSSWIPKNREYAFSIGKHDFYK